MNPKIIVYICVCKLSGKMKRQCTRVIVKIGSNVLTQLDGTLDVGRMSALVDQVAELQQSGVEIILVSSGAVASGRSEIKSLKKLNSVDQRQLFSAVGQAKLINHYYELFRKHGIVVGQVLTTKEDFGTRRHYLNQKNCIRVMLEHGVIPIVNENDTVSVTELMFTDNDELSGLVATMMNTEMLIILSNIDGIYNGSPSDPASMIIREIKSGDDLSNYIQQASLSSFGRGGMLTKAGIARKVADEGITVIIANGKRDNILVDLWAHPEDTVCTRFVPSAQPVSSIKKWIAHSADFAKGEIHVNKQMVEALYSNKAVSILPIGITRIEGEFERDDIVRIMDDENHSIGVGKTSYASAQVRAVIGKHGKRAVVHYDYLYLE
jgi:glutamate 5-kinase